MDTVFDFVKERRRQYRAYTIEIADCYEYSQYQTLRTIELSTAASSSPAISIR